MPRVLTQVESIWKRPKWQQERDAKNVPKGAVFGVSMGDELDKFHKAALTGVKEGKPACEKLKAALAKYKNGIKAKYKPFFDRIEKQLEYFVDGYISDAAKVLAAVPTYSKVREEASTQLLVAGAEFQHWEKGGSQGAFKPSNDKVLLAKLTALVDACSKLVFYTDKITESDRKTFDQTVYFASAGTWNQKTMIGLIKQVKELPNSV